MNLILQNCCIEIQIFKANSVKRAQRKMCCRFNGNTSIANLWGVFDIIGRIIISVAAKNSAQITFLEIQLLFFLNPEWTLKCFFLHLNPLMTKCMCRSVVPGVRSFSYSFYFVSVRQTPCLLSRLFSLIRLMLRHLNRYAAAGPRFLTRILFPLSSLRLCIISSYCWHFAGGFLQASCKGAVKEFSCHKVR